MEVLTFVSLLTVMLSTVDCLMFNLEPNARKCLKEEIHKGVLVTGEYEVFGVETTSKLDRYQDR